MFICSILHPIFNIRVMRQTRFITDGMVELLIPQVPIKEFTPSDCKTPDIKEINFFTLNTFPHIGDLVMFKEPGSLTINKVRSIEWASDNSILVSSNTSEPERVKLMLVAPIRITREILEKIGFQWDSRWGKFRLRLKTYPDMILWHSSYEPEELWWYVDGMMPIRFVHELQAIFRVHHIDQGLMEGLLFRLNEKEGLPSFLENLPI